MFICSYHCPQSLELTPSTNLLFHQIKLFFGLILILFYVKISNGMTLKDLTVHSSLSLTFPEPRPEGGDNLMDFFVNFWLLGLDLIAAIGQ